MSPASGKDQPCTGADGRIKRTKPEHREACLLASNERCQVFWPYYLDRCIYAARDDGLSEPYRETERGRRAPKFFATSTMTFSPKAWLDPKTHCARRNAQLSRRVAERAPHPNVVSAQSTISG